MQHDFDLRRPQRVQDWQFFVSAEISDCTYFHVVIAKRNFVKYSLSRVVGRLPSG